MERLSTEDELIFGSKNHRIVGSFFLLAGGLAITAGVMPLIQAGSVDWRLVGGTVAGLFFGAIGVRCLSAEEIRIFLPQQSYFVRRGLLGAKSFLGSFDDLDSLHLESKTVVGDDCERPHSVWVVYLVWKDPDVKRFRLCEIWELGKAYETCREVGEKLGVSLVDHTGLERFVLRPRVNEGPGKAIDLAAITLPDPPAGSRLAVRLQDQKIHLVFRTQNLNGRDILPALATLVALVVVGLSYLVHPLLPLVLALVLTPGLAPACASRFREFHVTAGAQNIIWQKRHFGWKAPFKTIPTASVQQMLLDPASGGILVLTDEGQFSIAENTPETARRYMVQVLTPLVRAAPRDCATAFTYKR